MAKLSFVRSSTPDCRRENMLDYSDYYTDIQSEILTKEQSLMPSVELYGSFQLKDNQRIECSIPFVYTQNDYNRSYMENDFLSLSDVEEKLYTISPSMTYSLYLKHQNTLTAQISHFHHITSSSYAGDYPSWQHLWSGETLLFIGYNQNFGKLFLNGRIGLSSMQYRLHGQGKVDYINPRGDLTIGWQINERQQFTIGSAIGNAYPEINMVNTAEQTIDQIHVRKGNPYLDKIKMYSANAMYSLQFGHFNLFGIFMYSAEIDTSLPYFFTEGNRVIESFRSGGNYHLLRSGLDLSWRAIDALQIRLSGRWQYSKITEGISQDQNSVYGKLDINYYWKDFSFNLHGQTQSKILNATKVYEWQDGDFGLSAAWHHANWTVEAGANNPFFTYSKTRNFLYSNVYSYDRQIYSRLNQPTGYVKVAYTVDFGKQTSKDYRNVNTTINSAILKAE